MLLLNNQKDTFFIKETLILLYLNYNTKGSCV